MTKTSRHELLYHLLAPTFLIFTPFISFLTYNDYGLLAPEVWICLAGLAALAVLCGLLGIAGGWLVHVVMTATLMVLFVDLQFNWFDGSNSWPKLQVIGVFVLTLLLSLALRHQLSRIVTAVFATLLTSTIVLAVIDAGSSRDPDPAAAPDSDRPTASKPPILVHFILDEHVGVDGIPDDVPHGKEMRAFLIDFFSRHRFNVFGRAYSHYANTYNSLANLVNFSSEAVDGAFTSGDEPDIVLLRNDYFRLLANNGYEIHVYQSDYMDFCSASKEYITSCQSRKVTGIKAIES